MCLYLILRPLISCQKENNKEINQFRVPIIIAIAKTARESHFETSRKEEQEPGRVSVAEMRDLEECAFATE